jgi:cytochrome c553
MNRLAGLVLLFTAVAPAIGAANDARLAACIACHESTGTRPPQPVPFLGGQPAFYVLTQLFLFRGERRDGAPMVQVMKGMSDADMQALANAVSRLPPPSPPRAKPESSRFDRGASLAKQHRCLICHGPDLAGTDQVPRLANQREDYLVKALRDFKRGTRSGYGQALMPELLAPLSDADLKDLAYFIHRFPAAGGHAH